MGPDAAPEGTPKPTASGGDPAGRPGALEMAQSLWLELRGLAHDRFRLAGLETQRAGESLVAMVTAGVMAGFLLACAWLGLLAAAVLWLVDDGMAAHCAVLLSVAVNLLFALVLIAVIRRKSRFLQFPATLRSLQPIAPKPQTKEQR
jgi:uncharacterized membrane protein YqjE